MRTAKDIMTPDPITVTLDLAVEKLAAIFWENKISGAPVVDDREQLLGVVTESDLIDQAKRFHIPTVISILDAFIVLERPKQLEEEIRKMTGATVGDIFSRDVVSVTEDTTVESIATLMAEKKIHTLPVVRSGRVVGVIGKADVIRTLIKQ